MKKLLLILICLFPLFLKCGESSVKSLECIYYINEHQPDIKRLVEVLYYDEDGQWLFNKKKKDWLEKNKKILNLKTNLVEKNGFYIFKMNFGYLDSEFKEKRLIKLSKSFDEVLFYKTQNRINESSFERKGYCKEINN